MKLDLDCMLEKNRPKGTRPFVIRDFILEAFRSVDLHDVKIIYDIGSLHAEQSIELTKVFPEAHVYCFEPDPKNLVQLKKNIEDGHERIHLVEEAVSITDGTATFYHLPGNMGASSLLYPDFIPFDTVIKDKEGNEIKNIIEPTTVKTINLARAISEGNLPQPDLLWVDVQGSEYLVFKSMDKYLEDVIAIGTEMGIKRYYRGHTLKSEIILLLEQAGFQEVWCRNSWHYEQDVILVNTRMLKDYHLMKGHE